MYDWASQELGQHDFDYQNQISTFVSLVELLCQSISEIIPSQDKYKL